MGMETPLRRQCGQWSLVGTLVAVAILVLLAALYVPRLLKPSAGPAAQQQTAMQRADGAACSEYVSQMDQAVMLYKQDHNDQPPTSIQDLTHYGVTSDMIHAPGCTYQMDPSTGNVTSGSSGGTAAPGGITIPAIPGAGG